ncbi:MAG: endonuclease III [Lachnospiraceae bacterium]|nr:endonuclease III [Lachnospiraceae bacterium]
MKESKKKRDERLQKILDALDREYGTDLRCALTHEDAWELLVATILSAQCTDARVNMVTPALFRKYPEPADFAQADLTELEQDIRSTGFYHNKAKNIIACARQIVEEHGGSVPSDLESLTKLAGVGRKTANVIRGNIYNEPSIVVDTHVKRISRLLGLTDTDDPTKAEFELMEILPKDHWILWNIDIITLGRTICIANRPKCENCFLREYCPSAGRTRTDKKSKSGEGVK